MRVRILVLAVALAVTSSRSALAQGTDPLVRDGFRLMVSWANQVWNSGDNPGAWTKGPAPTRPHPLAFGVDGNIDMMGVQVGYALEVDPDPFVSNSFSVTNNTGSTQQFMINLTIPISPALATTQISGSISGTVGDADGAVDGFGNGATVSTFGGMPYYFAEIDGVGVRQLYMDPQTHTAPLAGTNTISTLNYGPEASVAANTTIGITNRFELTSGSSVTFTSTFLVIPTPGTMGLLAIAGVVAIRRRR